VSRTTSDPQPARPDQVMDDWPPPQWEAVDEIDVADERPYASVPVRPLLQLAVRTGLWFAVGVGFVGGVAGLVGRSDTPSAGVVGEPTASESVPAAVAGTAEVAVTAWLTAASGDEERLAALFITPPSVASSDTDRLSVERATTVAGQRLGDGYWTVTVAVDVVEVPLPSIEDETDVDLAAEAAPPAVTWYVELGVVGDPEVGLAAMTTPAVMPGAPPLPEGWRVEGRSAGRPDAGDPVVAMVDGFLSALLTGSGDPSRYLAPGVEVPVSAPAPFADITIDEIGVAQLDEPAEAIQVWLSVTTPGGSRQSAFYEIEAAERDDRWEVLSVSGAPTVRAEEPGRQVPPTSAPATTGTTVAASPGA
jgi:hypothetical protein